MAQVFKPSADIILRAVILIIVIAVIVTVVSGWLYWHSGWLTDVAEAPEQPVPFSHRHHAGDLNIDCRYCHYTGEETAKAGLPTSETCMTCHSQLWTEAEALRPVRQAYTEGRPLWWQRVVDSPDFVYFNHAAHLDVGVGCTTCHGPVQEMALTYESHAYTMGWCLDCHRDPAPNLRPEGAVTAFDWRPRTGLSETERQALLEARDVHPERLTDCYTCHR
ncbi:Molybdopterin oxidoreductase subunit protein [Caenispirillum salinarum AK4]|uniref:Molybdopterin oxidoreductase subunit protein n=1 Tax=Caenispirillum salinarum AK4 TaxID=1238182 RepID=K9HN76_9PROT|nr:cytochrome c3 family protein [Caenispirillum salinarum]EKV31778.1 Molybdopterin oxidoreductase subunit protein [Caenispirillum salinarum AK4]